MIPLIIATGVDKGIYALHASYPEAMYLPENFRHPAALIDAMTGLADDLRVGNFAGHVQPMVIITRSAIVLVLFQTLVAEGVLDYHFIWLLSVDEALTPHWGTLDCAGRYGDWLGGALVKSELDLHSRYLDAAESHLEKCKGNSDEQHSH